MAYEPTNWKSGDIITSAKLNKLEQGVAGGSGILLVGGTFEGLDKTWQEIFDADLPIACWVDEETKEFALILSVYVADGVYYVEISNNTYTTDSADGYPVLGGK